MEGTIRITNNKVYFEYYNKTKFEFWIGLVGNEIQKEMEWVFEAHFIQLNGRKVRLSEGHFCEAEITDNKAIITKII